MSHLLFADDSLIVFRANGEDAQQLQSLLQVYEQCSGQKINKDKTAVMFSANVREEDKQEVMNALNIPRETANERYLGLPVFIGKSRRKAFEFLKDRIWKRMQGWKEKMLSNAGKEILIKAVAQAIPTYAMGCFEITKDLCDQISAMICRYWWSSQEKEKKLHWIRWEKLMRPKGEGGLGFKDIYTFNLAMLARQGWRLIQNKESLCCRILGAKYFPGGDVLQAVAKPCMSYSWRSILKGVQVLKKGIIWRVGNGANIKIWKDPWIPKEWSRLPSWPRRMNLQQTVDELVDPGLGTWDEQLVRQTFCQEDAEIILAIPVHTEMDDCVAWHYDKKGIFSVKSAYKVQMEDNKRTSVRGVQGTSAGSSLQKEHLGWHLGYELSRKN